MKRVSIFLTAVVLNFYVKAQELTIKEQAIVTIAAFTAKGDLAQLKPALNEGLNAGLTINEIKEVLVQLYAYAGFPRSLNALNTFIAVLKERKTNGKNDLPGKTSSPLKTDKSKLELGTQNQTKLVGQKVKGEVYEFTPTIDVFLKEHLFADIFGRDIIDWKTREIATIAALASLDGAENQLRSHLGVGMYNGLTPNQLNQIVSIIQLQVDAAKGNAASEILQTVLKQKGINTEPQIVKIQSADSIFPAGVKIANNNFTGNAYLQMLTSSDSANKIQVGSVTFEPEARTNWHLHPGGQILLVIEGEGYYQEKGSAKKIIRKGDVVSCPPNIPHWHGASHLQKLVHISISDVKNGAVIWMQPVTDEEYNN